MLEYVPFGMKIYITVLTFLLGLVMGSALNCLSWRIAHNETWSGGRSKCPACGHELGPLDLVPLFSWLFLKGKCRYCGEKVSARYPLTELCLGLCYLALLLKFDISWQFPVHLILVSCLFCLSLIDFDTQIIPNRFLIIPTVVRIVQLLPEGGLPGLWQGVLPALILGGSLLVLALVMDKVLKKESLGGGDIKLLAMLGLYFDLPCCLLLLLIACVIGLILAGIILKLDKDIPFPFGPAISLAAFVTLLWGSGITDWYLNLFL